MSRKTQKSCLLVSVCVMCIRSFTLREILNFRSLWRAQILLNYFCRFICKNKNLFYTYLFLKIDTKKILSLMTQVKKTIPFIKWEILDSNHYIFLKSFVLSHFQASDYNSVHGPLPNLGAGRPCCLTVRTLLNKHYDRKFFSTICLTSSDWFGSWVMDWGSCRNIILWKRQLMGHNRPHLHLSHCQAERKQKLVDIFDKQQIKL